MSFDPNNMKDRLKAAIAFVTDDDNPEVPPVPPVLATTVDMSESDGPSLLEEAGALAGVSTAAADQMPMKRPDQAPSSAPASIVDAPVADALPGGFLIGNLVFDANERPEPSRLLQVQGRWKHALVVRYIHPDRTHQERGEQRHHPNRLVRLQEAGFTVERLDDERVRLKGNRREVDVKMVGAVPVVF